MCSFPYENASSESGSRCILVMQPLLLSVHVPVNPPTGTSEARAALDALYEQLHSTLASALAVICLSYWVTSMLDRVGGRTSQWRSVIGPYGSDEVNANGERLLDFCANNNLIVSNSWFQHKSIHQLTWCRMVIVHNLAI